MKATDDEKSEHNKDFSKCFQPLTMHELACKLYGAKYMDLETLKNSISKDSHESNK